MTTTVPCAFLIEYTVSFNCVWLRLSKPWTFDPSVPTPIVEIKVMGKFDEEEMTRQICRIFEEEIDEVSISETGITISELYGSSVFVPGQAEAVHTEYSKGDYIAAYQRIEAQSSALEKENRAALKIFQTKAYVESLLSRATIKQGTFAPDSEGWVTYSRQMDLLRRIINRLES